MSRPSFVPEPLPADDLSFGVEQLAAAGLAAASDPARLTDRMINMIATYSMGDAIGAAQRREAAIAKQAAPPRAARNGGTTGQPFARCATPPTMRQLEAADGITAWMKQQPTDVAFPMFAGGIVAESIHALGDRLELVEKQRRELAEQVIELQQQVKELETRKGSGPGVAWAGAHVPSATYGAGALVQKRGGLWLALKPTSETPGLDPTAWRLLVREGKSAP